MIRRRLKTSRAERNRRKRGQSLVELCLAMPLLLLLLLGTIDLGRMFYYTVQLHNAVREGAGYGAHFPSDTSGMKSRVTSEAPFVTSTSASCSGSCTGTGGVVSGTGTVTVKATYVFTPVTTSFLQSWFGIPPVTLGATSSMNVLQ
jgi:Flp pilus assembly protein TadG